MIPISTKEKDYDSNFQNLTNNCKLTKFISTTSSSFCNIFLPTIEKTKYGFSEITEESISSKCLTQLTAYVVCVIGGWRSAQQQKCFYT